MSPDRTRVTRLQLLPILCLLATMAAPAVMAEDHPGIELAFLNSVFTNLSPEIAPIRQGPVTVRVSSPNHRLAVHRNHLRLVDAGAGRVAARFEIELEGEGHLVADIEAGISSRFEDEVTLPRQSLTIAGTIRLRQAEGGYDIELLELPKTIEIKIESALLRQLVSTCDGLAAILPVDCGALGASLSSVTAPLPEPGERTFLPAAYLTDAERAYFDRVARPR